MSHAELIDTLPEAPPVCPWTLKARPQIISFPGGPAEIGLIFVLSDTEAGKEKQIAATQEPELRQRIATKIGESQEHNDYKQAATDLDELQQESRAVQNQLNELDAEIKSSSLKKLRRLEKAEATCRSRLATINRALPGAAQRRDAAARALLAAAELVASDTTAEAIRDIESGRAALGTLADFTDATLRAQLRAEMLYGAIGRGDYGRDLARQVVEELISGPVPPFAPIMPQVKTDETAFWRQGGEAIPSPQKDPFLQHPTPPKLEPATYHQTPVGWVAAGAVVQPAGQPARQVDPAFPIREREN
jgi:hypothetical protein